MAWHLEGNPTNKRELEVYRYLNKRTGNSEFANTVTRFIDLRNYLDSKQFNSASELRQNVLYDDKPVFTQEESEKLYEMMENQKGGGNVELLDNVVRQWLVFLYGWTPVFITNMEDAVSPFVFILKSLETNPYFGQILGIGLDVVTSTLPVIAVTIQNLAPEIIGLIPIPESGPIGALIGWALSSVMVFLALAINLSRAHFGQAFLVTFLMIPFVGSSLYNAALSGERVLTKIAARREKLVDTSRNLFGNMVGDTVNAIIPDPLAEPPPFEVKPVDNSGIMGFIAEKAASVGLPTTLEGLKSKASELGVPTSIDEAKALASKNGLPTSIEEAKAKASQLGVPTSVEEATAKATELGLPVPKGGKRFSTLKRSTSKWRTQRKLRT
jgi:hypothetical protein